jgi:hypothetical protein
MSTLRHFIEKLRQPQITKTSPTQITKTSSTSENKNFVLVRMKKLRLMRKARWRRARFPKNPTSIQEAIDTFNRQLSTANPISKNFSMGQCNEEEGFIIFFCQDEDLRKFLSETKAVQSDATFRTTPKLFYQSLWLFFERSDLLFPFCCILMSGKSRELYDKVFNELKNFLPAMAPDFLMSDWEQALRGSLQDLFPEASWSGCHFHVAQSMYR